MKTRAEDDFLFVNLPPCLLHGPVLVRLARSINLILRGQDTEAWRQALGLSREGMERRSYQHMDRSKHLSHHVTKALVMHQADEVWEGIARHLFLDATGRRFGRPKTGRWWDYTRMPGRARSHTTARKWETFGLHGALAGHLAVYRHRGLSPAVTTSVPPGGEPQPVRDVKAAAGPRGKPRFQAVPGR